MKTFKKLAVLTAVMLTMGFSGVTEDFTLKSNAEAINLEDYIQSYDVLKDADDVTFSGNQVLLTFNLMVQVDGCIVEPDSMEWSVSGTADVTFVSGVLSDPTSSSAPYYPVKAYCLITANSPGTVQVNGMETAFGKPISSQGIYWNLNVDENGNFDETVNYDEPVESTENFDWVPKSYQEVKEYAPISIHDGYIVLNGAGLCDIAAEWSIITEGSTAEYSEVYYAYFQDTPKSPDIVGGVGCNEFHVLKPEGDGILSITWEYVTHGQPSMDKQYQAEFVIQNGVIMEEPEPTDPVPPDGDNEAIYEPGGAISLNHVPDKTVYQIGEELDLTGLAISLNYYYGKDGHSLIYNQVNPADYPEAFIIDTSEFDSSVPGTYTIRIRCTEETYGEYWVYLVDEVKFDVTVTSGIAGDVNDDGEFSVLDVILFQKWLLNIPDTHLDNWKAVDFNQDNVLNIFDLLLMKKALIEQNQSEIVPALVILDNAIIESDTGWTSSSTFHVIDTQGIRYSVDADFMDGHEEDDWDYFIDYTIENGQQSLFIQNANTLNQISEFTQSAFQYQDCGWDVWNFQIEDYGMERLWVVYPDENHQLNTLELCEFGWDCAWLDHDDVKKFVTMLVQDGYYADAWLFDQHMTVYDG